MYLGSRYNYFDYQRRNVGGSSTGFIPFRYRFQSPRVYPSPSYSRIKGNKIDKTNNEDSDILKIKIGGEEILTKKKRKHQRPNNRIKSTKYTIFTFLPRNLLEQFRRIANFYFLIMTIISSSIDSPVSPITSLVPLLFVISVTATKQGYEDYLRYRADNIVNCSLVTVIRNGKEMDIHCEKVLQGDLVVVSKDCDVPCDLVILKSSDSNGKCFITTANLDGETNLKGLRVPLGLPVVNDDKLHTLGMIECEKPRVDLYSFTGRIILSPVHTQFNNEEDLLDGDVPLLADNLLLRGSRVKNTDWVIGCAVYVGQNTKLALNSRLTRRKVPSSENYINKFLIIILGIQMTIVVFCYIMKRYYDLTVIENHQYIRLVKNQSVVKEFFQDFLSFLILFNYLIPISLYVTIELHKFLGSFFMEWDKDLYDEKTDQPCLVNTSDLNEELGQVNILFSDKTGTLTKNEMYFQKCSIKGKTYIYKKTKLQEEYSNSELDVNNFNTDHFTFFKALAICHSVQVAIKDENEVSLTEQVQNVHTFDQIREESSNEKSNESETDENDFLNAQQKPSGNGDNPLQNTLSEFSLSSRNSKMNLATRDNRIHPVTETIAEHESSINLQPPIIEILNQSSRPPFNRSSSNIDLPSMSNKSVHRRTQSYGMQQSFSKVDGVTLSRSSSLLRRSVSRRESYAQPFYTQQSILMRKESSKRKKEIKSVVEKLDYQSSSPDEKALVEASANLGIIYTGDVDDEIRIYVYPPHLSTTTSSTSLFFQTKKLSFTKLNVIEFTSDRKKMSVIVRDSKREIWLYTKGAESYVLPLCSATPSELVAKTQDHVNNFAKYGLRTLIIARRKLSEKEYRNFSNELNRANTAIGDRSNLLAQCYQNVEKDLELLGATAVEDALQDDVADTLVSLQEAGIKIWVLTGDKVETALNIALSCGHIPEYASKYFITECRNDTQFQEHLRVFDHEIRTRHNEVFALLIDGVSLATALKHAPQDFSALATKCQAVLCCRLSPLQKCEVVRLIKKSHKEYITAAIGDGANDVSMIQEAHVGLGIVGKEGRQAARCADFSFSKFKMLKRLLLVHGHYHTYRLSTLVLYFFYKNTVFMGIQFLFQFHSMFSTESIYDSLFLTLYNVTYTALPILFLSLTEKPFKEEVLFDNPKLYKNNIFNRLLYWDRFFCWIFFGIYHSLVCFYVSYYVWRENNIILTYTPYTVGLSCFGTIVIHNVVVLVNFKLWMEAIFQSYLFIATIIFSITGFILSTIAYNFVTTRYDKDIYWIYNNMLMSLVFWLISILMIILSLLPDYTLKISRALNICQRSIFPGNKLMKRLNNNNWIRNNDTNMQTTSF